MGLAALDLARVTSVFMYGPFADPAFRQAVFGRRLDGRAAVLPGARLAQTADGSLAELASAESAKGVEGLVIERPRASDLMRLAVFTGGAGAARRVAMPGGGSMTVLVPGGSLVARDAPDWTMADWRGRWGATARLAAGAVVAAGDPARAMERWPLLLIRAGARLRAQGASAPAALRRRPGPGDVAEAARRQPYAAYFAVEEYDLSFRRFDGAMSERLTRAVFISGDAAVVLPYDPVRDRVLVIEQWRAGPHARGDGLPWLIEAVAGRVDGGETPPEAARREALEEAGLDLRALLPAAEYYPSPAAKGEYLYTYVGIADLPDDAARIGGLPGEGEDIRAHVIPFERLAALVASGEVNNAPLILLAWWLDRNRADLRAAAGAGG